MLAAASTPKARAQAQQSIVKARAKASSSSIERAVFSLCIFELEDRVLATIDEYFTENGWTVASLIFDGLHVEHRSGHRLADAMRGAEERVRTKLGYVIKLDEKPLSYTGLSYGAAAPDADGRDTVAEGLAEMAEDEMPLEEMED